MSRLLIDVRAVDDLGNPIRGLSAADFRVRIDGRPARVESASLGWRAVAGKVAGRAPVTGTATCSPRGSRPPDRLPLPEGPRAVAHRGADADADPDPDLPRVDRRRRPRRRALVRLAPESLARLHEPARPGPAGARTRDPVRDAEAGRTGAPAVADVHPRHRPGGQGLLDRGGAGPARTGARTAARRQVGRLRRPRVRTPARIVAILRAGLRRGEARAPGRPRIGLLPRRHRRGLAHARRRSAGNGRRHRRVLRAHASLSRPGDAAALGRACGSLCVVRRGGARVSRRAAPPDRGGYWPGERARSSPSGRTSARGRRRFRGDHGRHEESEAAC